ncbi:leucine-rich repeat flightless-interacting protein 2 isoform X2 [Sardina pilchardus]|uniref:leucine-rich repeat flightless-interacting protein 2 isoform X2 n=1 Tax=Sardina pilchardus TaxID=27697 RepID=UPI002E110058
MHCGSLERMGTPRKRTLSRGMSEDESLRHIIKEAEETTKRLTRSDSKYGSLKKGERRSEEDSLAEIPDMIELQANYDGVLQELHYLEVQRETLLFQVDCLQDALEGAEEMLAEAQREAHDTSLELEREKEGRRKLEDMVSSLMQEVERLKEERNSIPAVPVYTLIRDDTQETAAEDSRDTQTTTPPPQNKTQPEGTTQEAPFTVVRLDSTPVTPGTTDGQADGSSGGLLSFFKKGKGDQAQDDRTGPAWIQNAPMGTSVDQDPAQEKSAQDETSDGPLAKLTRMVKNFGHTPSLDLSEQPVQEGVFRGPSGDKSTGEDPDDNDESSGYEDAQSDLLEQEALAGASTPDGTPDGGFLEDELADEDGEAATNTGEPGSPKPNDSCVLS